jgi:hypothetical protein
MLDIGSISLFYNHRNNTFVDDNGFIVWNIFEAITPNDLYLFKHHKEYTIVNHRTLHGVVVELFWPGEDEYYFDPSLCHDYSVVNLGDD